ncbi:hypothetical protein ANDA3_2966 [plant metagenome]|uniref:Uncharacterized protein n=2 Tax=root TaxID=1 RepID=A0A1C3K0T8_9BURK|nr:hypothetical protein ODI_01949 [Orrella dioscoreae]SOE50770.1 hypothetical protein ODI_R2958 [Orrella dioscoreae]
MQRATMPPRRSTMQRKALEDLFIHALSEIANAEQDLNAQARKVA